MKVTVFCSCSAEVNAFFREAVRLLGQGLAQDGHSVVYGGSSGGCMGALAEGVITEGGRLIGVVPEMDFMDGRLQSNLTEHVAVKNLSARIDAMIDLGEAFVVCPGGLGTLDEAFAVLALKACGSLPKPVLFYNYLGVWEPLLEALDLLAQQNLIRRPVAELISRVDTLEDVRRELREPSFPVVPSSTRASLADGNYCV